MDNCAGIRDNGREEAMNSAITNVKSPLKRRTPNWSILAALSVWWADSALLAELTEEFIGPFPNWADVKRDYGAVGNGQVDDTAALQKALDELTKHTNSCVLYVPAGKYRLTGTLKTVRQAHTDCQGVAVIGEDPARTILSWDGTNGGTMFQWDAWYSKISRLTFDGASRAAAGLLYGPALSRMTAQSPVGSRTRLPVRLTGEPHECPVEKSKKHREPTLMLLTAEKAMRLMLLRSAMPERRKSDSQTCQLPMTLWTPRPQSSNRPYHTQMSIEFQFTV